MPSLSSWDVGKATMEGRRYAEDIAAANEAFDILNAPLEALQAQQRKNKDRIYSPRKVITLGNHEDRITRAANNDPKLCGLISTDDLNYTDHGWEVVPYLQPIDIDGVWYCHVYVAPMTGRPLGGQAATRIKTIGHTFTMGHQQTLDYALRFVAGRSQHALICGACYLHDEQYKGPQGNAHWRGVVVKHQVDAGSYDPMFVSLDYLCRKYEGTPLAEFMTRYEEPAA